MGLERKRMTMTPKSLLSTVLVMSSLSLSLAGCMTFVSSQKASLGEKGIDYCLPIPVISVTPSGGSTPAFKLEHIPDPDQQYKLSTSSVISSYTLDVTRDGCFLTKVTLDAKSDAVAVAVANAAGAVGQAHIETQTAERDAAVTAQKAAADKIEAAKQKLLEARAKLRTMQDGRYSSQFTPKDLADAEVAVAVAQANYDALTGVANVADAAADNPDKGVALQAWGPVYYQINQGLDADGIPTVDFVAIEFPDKQGQNQFQTVVLKGGVSEPVKVGFSELKENVAERNAAGDLSVTLKVKGKVTDVVELADKGGIFSELNDKQKIADAKPKLADDKQSVTIALPKTLKPGIYMVRFGYTTSAGGAVGEALQLFSVP
jgi:hypothetical protein